MKFTLILGAALILFANSGPASAQTAPQRSAQLCAVLQQITEETSTYFATTGPGQCAAAPAMNGYSVLVQYQANTLVIGLVVDITGKHGVGLAEPMKDKSMFWFSLSVFDNLVHTALGTRDQDVFEKMNKLALRALPQAGHVQIYDSSQRATLQAAIDSGEPLFLLASASAKDIGKMKSSQQRKDAGDVASWRKILALSLQSFAAGAKGYSDAYQGSHAQHHDPVSCYTSFLGNAAVTNCY